MRWRVQGQCAQCGNGLGGLAPVARTVDGEGSLCSAMCRLRNVLVDGEPWDCSVRVDALRAVVESMLPQLDCHVLFELGCETTSGRPVECGPGWVRVEVWPDWDSSVVILWDAVLDVEVCGVIA
jgi:hypothetical protein